VLSDVARTGTSISLSPPNTSLFRLRCDRSKLSETEQLLFCLALMHPEIAIVWADSAYAGKLVTWAKTYLDITVKTVRRPPDAKGFARRWVVEEATRAPCMTARRVSARGGLAARS
jgi:hypothetical protein